MIVVLLEKLGVDFLAKYAEKSVYIPVPQLFNIDYHAIASATGGMLDIDTCEQWFMFSYEGVADDEKTFFGSNEGEPIQSPASSGVLSNIANSPCSQISKTSPYFKEFTTSKYKDFTNMENYIYGAIENLHS